MAGFATAKPKKGPRHRRGFFVCDGKKIEFSGLQTVGAL
jgi:hypothetical protein